MRIVVLMMLLPLSGCVSVHLGGSVGCELAGEGTVPWPAPVDAGAPLHILSWNLHGTPMVASMGDRLARVAQAVLQRGPDLVVLQEVWFRGDAERLAGVLARTYERIDDASSVTDHAGWIIGFRRAGLLALRRTTSSWTLAGRSSFQPFEVAASAWLVWQGDGLATKGIQRFELRRGSQRLIVLNTHLQSPYLKEEDPFGHDYPYAGVRSAQILQLVAFAEREGDVPVIIVGDFNTTPKESALYKELTHDWVDLTADVRKQCDCGTIVDDRKTRKDWIDYLFARRPAGHGIRVDRMRLVQNFRTDCPYSDHHGLEARIWLTAPLK